jgi:hypothetical protein
MAHASKKTRNITAIENRRQRPIGTMNTVLAAATVQAG